MKDHPLLSYGAVANSWKPTNLGCWFHHGGIFKFEYEVFKDSFAWDGDLYGWDEAMLYTRKPVVFINDTKPPRRFDYWYPDTVLRGVTWLQIADGELCGGYQETSTRADVVKWDKDGIHGGAVSQTISY